MKKVFLSQYRQSLNYARDISVTSVAGSQDQNAEPSERAMSVPRQTSGSDESIPKHDGRWVGRKNEPLEKW